ncbi:MAG: LysR family transcriptional regulator [Rhizobiales bacterium]|nr:LysR family transcriptional regulator [Hyphomicrobiales bacterium]
MPVRFTFRQLEYFVAVGEAGSIARAAEMCNVSAPSISTAIQQLEQELGVSLFVRRHAQGLSLTTGGRQLLAAAKELLAEAEALASLAGDITERVGGLINIGCLTTFAQLVLPGVRRSFQALHPDVRIRQFDRHQSQIIDMLQRGEIDIALTYDLEIPQDVGFEPLIELPPFALLAADDPLAERETIGLGELASLPLILLDLPLSRDYFLSMFRQLGLSPTIAERTGDYPLVRSMVANGLGYSLGNVRPISNLAPDGRAIRYVRLSDRLRPMRLGLATAEGGRRARNVEAFAQHCRRVITPQDTPGLAPTSG